MPTHVLDDDQNGIVMISSTPHSTSNGHRTLSGGAGVRGRSIGKVQWGLNIFKRKTCFENIARNVLEFRSFKN